jgi:hypothetical protein
VEVARKGFVRGLEVEGPIGVEPVSGISWVVTGYGTFLGHVEWWFGWCLCQALGMGLHYCCLLEGWVVEILVIGDGGVGVGPFPAGIVIIQVFTKVDNFPHRSCR